MEKEIVKKVASKDTFVKIVIGIFPKIPVLQK